MAGLGVKFRWHSGNPRFAADMLHRFEHPELAVIEPWRRTDVPRRILGMYQRGGRVGGEHGQGPWKPLRQSTVAQKGHSKVLLGGRASSLFQFGRMSRRYRVVTKRTQGGWWTATISNEARSADGYDYPSLHHTGGKNSGTFTVRPRKAGGVLRWRDANGTEHFARETHPHRVPARPHLQFYGLDVRNLQRRMLRYTLGGQRAGQLGLG
ncbi:MAG: hypothetical protein KC729_00105 [Candidatus Eisenbacteria bacterium]|uniref:Uncharacterized protein n=1 Tax=Eiseniibacteriota bacterium TaxID=2212470 RepID=A0A956LWW2_UNCEI|nr:hypothetical protein [Candidatus Eisenbacteria bacterium]